MELKIHSPRLFNFHPAEKGEVSPTCPLESAECDVNNKHLSPVRISKSNQGSPALQGCFATTWRETGADTRALKIQL